MIHVLASLVTQIMDTAVLIIELLRVSASLAFLRHFAFSPYSSPNLRYRVFHF